MANEKHLEILHQGVDAWNAWRERSPGVFPDLTEADLSGADLAVADLRRCYLSGARLMEASLPQAYLDGSRMVGTSLIGARLSEASLVGTDLSRADLTCADLSRAQLDRARLLGADLTGARLDMATLDGADLKGARLIMTSLVLTNLTGADLTGCEVYGCSVWDSTMDADTKQSNLIITRPGQATITVDNLEVAQFIYMLLNNRSIRNAIDTITSKVVLILGRFTPERKIVLDTLRDKLRKHDYLPILFDFDVPSSRNITETLSTLAHIARFVIADITDAKSIPQELQRIVPSLPSLPVQPLLLSSQYEYSMFKDFLDYPWVLMPYRYDTLEDLLAALEEKVIAPALAKLKEIKGRRMELEKEINRL